MSDAGEHFTVSVTVPAELLATWAAWIAAGQAARVGHDLADLLTDARNAGIMIAAPFARPDRDPPSSSATGDITTR